MVESQRAIDNEYQHNKKNILAVPERVIHSLSENFITLIFILKIIFYTKYDVIYTS